MFRSAFHHFDRVRAGVISTALLCLCLIPFSATAQTSDWTSGWYASLDGGIGFRKDQDSVGVAINRSARAIDIEFGAGGSVGFRLGRRFQPASDYGLRAEIELRHERNDILSLESLGILIPEADGDQGALLAMANGYIDLLAPLQPFTPYIGLGVGVMRHDTDITFPGTEFKDHIWKFSYQFMIGSSFRFAKSWEISAEAQYRMGTSAHLLAIDAATLEPIVMDVNYDHFAILVGVRYWF